MMEWFLIWLALGVLTGWIAGGKGRSGFGWFLFGLLVPVIALIAALVIESPARKAERAALLALAQGASPAAGVADPVAWLATATAPSVLSDQLKGLEIVERGSRKPLSALALALQPGDVLDLKPDAGHRLGADTVVALAGGERVGFLARSAGLASVALARGCRASAVVDHIDRTGRLPVVTIVVTVWPRQASVST